MNYINATMAAIVALGVIGAVAVLTWHGSITGEAAVGIFSGIIFGGGVGAAAHVGVKTGAQAASSNNYSQPPTTAP